MQLHGRSHLSPLSPLSAPQTLNNDQGGSCGATFAPLVVLLVLASELLETVSKGAANSQMYHILFFLFSCRGMEDGWHAIRVNKVLYIFSCWFVHCQCRTKHNHHPLLLGILAFFLILLFVCFQRWISL